MKTPTTKGWTCLLSSRPVLTLEGTSERASISPYRQSPGHSQDTYWRIFAFSETRPTVFCLAPAPAPNLHSSSPQTQGPKGGRDTLRNSTESQGFLL